MARATGRGCTRGCPRTSADDDGREKKEQRTAAAPEALHFGCRPTQLKAGGEKLGLGLGLGLAEAAATRRSGKWGWGRDVRVGWQAVEPVRRLILMRMDDELLDVRNVLLAAASVLLKTFASKHTRPVKESPTHARSLAVTRPIPEPVSRFSSNVSTACVCVSVLPAAVCRGK